MARRISLLDIPAASAATVDTEPQKKKRRGRKNVEYEGEERHRTAIFHYVPLAKLIPTRKKGLKNILIRLGWM